MEKNSVTSNAFLPISVWQWRVREWWLFSITVLKWIKFVMHRVLDFSLWWSFDFASSNNEICTKKGEKFVSENFQFLLYSQALWRNRNLCFSQLYKLFLYLLPIWGGGGIIFIKYFSDKSEANNLSNVAKQSYKMNSRNIVTNGYIIWEVQLNLFKIVLFYQCLKIVPTYLCRARFNGIAKITFEESLTIHHVLSSKVS